jgi:hypothetical protein
MDRTGTVLVTAVLVLMLATAAVGVTGGSSTFATGGDDTPAVTGNAVDDTPATGTTTRTATVKPGAQFVGVIGAHGANHTGAIEEAAIDARLAGANSAEARAAVVADVLAESQNRTDSLAERKVGLARARANGTMNESEYRTRLAVVDAELRTVERVAVTLEDVADGLLTTGLIDVDIDLESIVNLKTRAIDLQGPELGQIAPSFDRSAGNDTTGSATNVTVPPVT